MDATPFILNSRVYFIAFLRHRKFSTLIMLAARMKEIVNAARMKETVNAVALKYIALGLYFRQISLDKFFLPEKNLNGNEKRFLTNRKY